MPCAWHLAPRMSNICDFLSKSEPFVLPVTLQHMLKEGLALLDLGAADSVPLYWFPCVSPDAELA